MPSQKQNAKSIWHTDGSKPAHDHGANVLEAGLLTYYPQEGTHVCCTADLKALHS